MTFFWPSFITGLTGQHKQTIPGDISNKWIRYLAGFSGDSVNNKLFKFLCVHTITDRMTRSKWRSRWFNYLSSLTVHIKLPYRMGKIWDCRLADQDLEKHILNVETLFCMRDHNVDISYTAFFNVIISVPIHVPLVCVDIAHKR